MKVKIRFTIETEYEVPDEWEESMVQFHLEENLCHDNIIDHLARLSEAQVEHGYCYSCCRSKVEIIE